jgi:hypothetical protein
MTAFVLTVMGQKGGRKPLLTDSKRAGWCILLSAGRSKLEIPCSRSEILVETAKGLKMSKAFLTLAFAVALLSVAKADTLTDFTSRVLFAGTDSVDWGQLGVSRTGLSNPVNATSTGGIGVVLSKPVNPWERRDQGNGWDGDFAPGDHLLWDGGSGAPWTITFSQLIDGLGFQIQPDLIPTAFTVQLQVFGATNNLLGSFSENGNSTAAGDNSAIFIGIKDGTGANISSAQINVTVGGSTFGDFAINTMALAPAGSSVPEPASLVFVASAILGIGYKRWKTVKAKA